MTLHTTGDTYLWSPPSSGARGHSCLGLRTGVSPHFSTNSMRAMVAAQRQCVIGSELVRCSGDAAERPAGPRRRPAGSWRAPPPPPHERAMPSLAPDLLRYARSWPATLLIMCLKRCAGPRSHRAARDTAARPTAGPPHAPRTTRDLRNFTAEF